MRIIHTSDWHLGQYFYGKSRANEHQMFLSWLLRQVAENSIDAIIIAGDVFDTSTPPSYAREMYFDFIAKLQGSNCQLIVLAGNHDSVAMLSESQAVLASLSTRVITHAIPKPIIDSDREQGQSKFDQQVFEIKKQNGQIGAIICAIPFIRPRDVIKSRAGQSASEKQQNLQQAISEHYQELYQRALTLREMVLQKQGDKVPIIATGHITALGVSISDSKSDSVRDIYIGSLEAFPASAFPPADYIALGHIHRAQKVAKSEHIRYSGSPIALSFDEAKQDKRVFMVEFFNGKLHQVSDMIVPCFQPLYMVKTSLDELEENLAKTLVMFKKQQAQSFSDQKTKSDRKAKAWLDIEIDNSEHLSALYQLVSELVTDMPFEILLVRRCKKARQQRQSELSGQDHSTLSELSMAEVFDSRLAMLDWQTEQEVSRKARLTVLFNQISAQANEKKLNSEVSELVEQEKEADVLATDNGCGALEETEQENS